MAKTCTCPDHQIIRSCARHGNLVHAAANRQWYAKKKRDDPVWYRQYLERMRIYNQGYRRGQQTASTPRVQLVCCGVWQAVTTLPHVCAQCGRRYLEPAGEGR